MFHAPGNMCRQACWRLQQLSIPERKHENDHHCSVSSAARKVQSEQPRFGKRARMPARPYGLTPELATHIRAKHFPSVLRAIPFSITSFNIFAHLWRSVCFTGPGVHACERALYLPSQNEPQGNSTCPCVFQTFWSARLVKGAYQRSQLLKLSDRYEQSVAKVSYNHVCVNTADYQGTLQHKTIHKASFNRQSRRASTRLSANLGLLDREHAVVFSFLHRSDQSEKGDAKAVLTLARRVPNCFPTTVNRWTLAQKCAQMCSKSFLRLFSD